MSGFWDFLSGNTVGGAVSSTAKAVVDSVLGNVDKIIRDFKLPPEQMVNYETRMAELQASTTTKLQELSAADRNSARQMEMATRSRMPALLTLFYTASFVSLSGAILYMSYAVPDLTLSAFQAGMIGSIWGALAKEAALGSSFYLGSSSGSDTKNDAINMLVKQGNGTNGTH